MYLLSLSEFTAIIHCSLPSLLRYSTTYTTFDDSGSATELHARDTELCDAAVDTRSSGASVGLGVVAVVGGGVVVVTSESCHKKRTKFNDPFKTLNVLK